MALYMDPEPEKLETEPPLKERSASVKSVELLESTKLSEAVSPAFSDEVLDVRAMVGKPCSSLSPTMPEDRRLIRMSAATPVRVVMLEPLMAPVVLSLRLLRAAAATVVSVMVMA